jgi:hypothetical protein
MERQDLFSTVHDGLRSLLCRNVSLLASTSFCDPPSCSQAIESLRAMLGFLVEHGEHEDDVVMPEIRRLAPELFEQLQAEHSRLDGAHAALAAQLDRFATSTPVECGALGVRLRRELHQLVALHFVHMAREEISANRVLQAHLDDAGLLTLRGRIVSRIEPTRASQWFALILPAVDPQRRADMVSGMRKAMPTAVFEQVLAPARAALGAAWQAAIAEAAAR